MGYEIIPVAMQKTLFSCTLVASGASQYPHRCNSVRVTVPGRVVHVACHGWCSIPYVSRTVIRVCGAHRSIDVSGALYELRCRGKYGDIHNMQCEYARQFRFKKWV